MPAATATAPPVEEAIVIETLEIDLSEALAGLGIAPPVGPPPPAVTVEESGTPQDLESVFDEMRSRDPGAGDASVHYERALQYLEDDRVEEAMAELKRAARAPQFRFRASSRLGRLYVTDGDFQEGIEWLERAAEAPAPSPDEGLLLLYDLAGTLERAGETARALAVLLELDADRSGYRDVRERIERLTRAQAGTREA
jgi:tetratricopeptide (TPR) repeat protein